MGISTLVLVALEQGQSAGDAVLVGCGLWGDMVWRDCGEMFEEVSSQRGVAEDA